MKRGGNGIQTGPVATGKPNSASSVLPFPDTMAEQQIGRELQALYDKIVAEPLPDQLVDLLRRLNSESK